MAHLREVPPRGSFDYLVTTPIPPDEVVHAPPRQPRLPPEPPRKPQRPPVREPVVVPPARGYGDPPGRPRVRVEIEIVERGTARPRQEGVRLAAALIWLVVATIVAFLLLTGSPHAASPPKGDGNVPDEVWDCTSYRMGGHTYEDCRSNTGRVRHCDTWQNGETEMTECS